MILKRGILFGRLWAHFLMSLVTCSQPSDGALVRLHRYWAIPGSCASGAQRALSDLHWPFVFTDWKETRSMFLKSMGLTYLSALWLLPTHSPYVGSLGIQQFCPVPVYECTPSRASHFKPPLEAFLQKPNSYQCESVCRLHWTFQIQLRATKYLVFTNTFQAENLGNQHSVPGPIFLEPKPSGPSLVWAISPALYIRPSHRILLKGNPQSSSIYLPDA